MSLTEWTLTYPLGAAFIAFVPGCILMLVLLVSSGWKGYDRMPLRPRPPRKRKGE